jgi:hypothetical protein
MKPSLNQIKRRHPALLGEKHKISVISANGQINLTFCTDENAAPRLR